MEIIELDINLLKPASYNPRALSEQEKADLKASLETFGIVDPIIVNKNKDRLNIIIGGHQRYYIWKEMGNKTIPCVYIDLSLELEQELNIRLNKNLGHFRWDLLANFDEELLKKVGFNAYELNEIFDLALSKEQATAEHEENKRQVVLSFDECEDMNGVENIVLKELKELIEKYKIKCRINC